MRKRLADEQGLTLVELIIVMFVLSLVMAALANAFVSGLRANSDTTAKMASQGEMRLALDRLEYEVRCSSGATVSGSGSTVVLTLPSQCVHATGSYTWCVVSGSLMRYANSACSGSGQAFITNVTTPTPFSLTTGTGLLPRLGVNLGVNTGAAPSDAVSFSDTITLRNGTRG